MSMTPFFLCLPFYDSCLSYLFLCFSDISYDKEISFIRIYLQLRRLSILRNLIVPSVFGNRIPPRSLLRLKSPRRKLLVDPPPIPILVHQEVQDRPIYDRNQMAWTRPRRKTRGQDLHDLLVLGIRNNLQWIVPTAPCSRSRDAR